MVPAPDIGEKGVVELLCRLGRAMHCMQFSQGLNPAQWEALRYLARANRYSRTPSALADFLGTTKGTASQTVKALQAKGYVRRQPEPADRRACRLEITEAGRDILRRDPIRDVAAGLTSTGLDMVSTAAGLELLLRGLRADCGVREFGVCERCRHFCGDAACAEEGGPHRCGLTGEPLSVPETSDICVNFGSCAS